MDCMSKIPHKIIVPTIWSNFIVGLKSKLMTRRLSFSIVLRTYLWGAKIWRNCTRVDPAVQDLQSPEHKLCGSTIGVTTWTQRPQAMDPWHTSQRRWSQWRWQWQWWRQQWWWCNGRKEEKGWQLRSTMSTMNSATTRWNYAATIRQVWHTPPTISHNESTN